MISGDAVKEIVRLTDGCSEASVSTTGAELKSWTVGGREILWTGDPSFWPRTAPVLFPVVGWCAGNRITVDGVTYPMDVHGFASSAEFLMTDKGADSVTLMLSDSESTRRRFPFRFAFGVTYSIEGASLSATLAVRNLDSRPMPYAVGLHPGFLWTDRNLDQDACLRFEKAEYARLPVISPEGLFASALRTIAMHDNCLPLNYDTLNGEALCFLNCNSRAATFMRSDGSEILIENSGFPHMAVWTKPSAPLLSIESWTGHGDPVGYDGELAAKPSMRILAPGHCCEHSARYSFRGDAIG